jgi:hypothetical protein
MQTGSQPLQTEKSAMRHHLVPFTVPAIGAALVVAWATASAPAAAPAGRPAPRCFLASNVNGFTPRGNDAVDVHVGVNRDYRLTLAGYCPDVDWSLSVALRTTGGGSWICQGADAEIIVPSPSGRQRCLVSDVRPLTAAEVAANSHHHH